VVSAVASVRTRRRALGLVFVVLFALSQALLWYAYYGHGAKALIGDEQGYQASALAILAGGTWMPSTIWPPLQPLLLAAIYAIFGIHLLAVQIVQTLLLIACAALLRDLWRHLGGSVAAANTAAALFLLNPAIAAYAQWLWPEIPHLFLLLAAFCLLARLPSRFAAFVAGGCIGLAILAKSLLSVFWPVFLIAFVRRERPHILLRPTALFVLGLALLTGPALLHGWHTSGRPMIADSSVYNLSIGLTDRWRSDYVDDMGGVTLPEFLASGSTPAQRNAVYMEKLRGLIAERGMAPVLLAQLGRQYFRLFSAKTSLVSQLPGAACAGHLSVYRTPSWLTHALTALNDVFHALLLMAAAFGIACWRWRIIPRQRRALLGIVALFFIYQLALMLLIHVKARFLLPMIPFLCGFAGSFLVALRNVVAGAASAATPLPALTESRVTTEAAAAMRITPPRLALGTLLATLLLFLAFAGPALDHLCAG
jgi:4-amino-4-deoxy-L-arabinose transferase-like glycosyltransferase